MLVSAASVGQNVKNNYVPILYHYDDPAREKWRITFNGEKHTYCDSDIDKPIADFRWKKFEEHARDGKNILPILLAFEFPKGTNSASFGELFLRVVQEANRTRVPYVVTITPSDGATAFPIRSSKLPAAEPIVLLQSNGALVSAGVTNQPREVIQAVADMSGPFRSKTIVLHVESELIKSPTGVEHLCRLLSHLNKLRTNGSPEFLYSISILAKAQ